VAVGNTDDDLLSTLANRLIRLDKQINDREKTTFAEHAQGKTIPQVVKELLNAHDPDTLESIRLEVASAMPGASPLELQTALTTQHLALLEAAVAVFHNPDLRNFVVDVRKKYDQIIDHINPDEILNIGWVKDNKAGAEILVNEFRDWIETHKTEITALQIFYGQPYLRRDLSFKMIKDLSETLKNAKPTLAPLHVWRAWEQLEKANGQPKHELMALVSLIRRILGNDETLTAYDKTVDKNFQDWVFRKQAGSVKFSEEQMNWLRMIKDYVATSFHLDRDDFDLSPFNAAGGLGKMYQVFGADTEEIIVELNEVLAA
jgi:type I restriction enzyme R subunit